MAEIQLQNISKRRGSFVGVDNFDLTVADREFLVLLGPSGCGTKHGQTAFQDNWQRPFQAAFSDKVAIDEARLFMGEWAACFGAQHALHSGTFMGVPATGKRVVIPYMDLWKVVDGKIAENWVSVDFPHVLAQLDVDVFDGEGWEHYDSGARVAPQPGGVAPRLGQHNEEQ